VLILCTHNFVPSIFGEAMPNHWTGRSGKDVRARRAGGAASGRLSPLAPETLNRAGVDIEGYRSKSREEFAAEDAPEMRAAITACGSTAAVSCPNLPGNFAVHRDCPGPSAAPGGRKGRRQAFADAPSNRMPHASAAPAPARAAERCRPGVCPEPNSCLRGPEQRT